jgi:hypothetical protein
LSIALLETRETRFAPLRFASFGEAGLFPLVFLVFAAMMGVVGLPLFFIDHHPSQKNPCLLGVFGFIVVSVSQLYWTSFDLNLRRLTHD